MRLRFTCEVTLAFLLLAGCANSSDVPVAGPAPDGITIKSEGTDQLTLDPPNVVFDSRVMTVRGRVHRKPGVTTDISGRMDIEVISPEGVNSQLLTALLTPDPVPSEDNGESGYVVYFGWIPPKGSTVDVHFADWPTAKLEDMAGDSSADGSAHGARGRISH